MSEDIIKKLKVGYYLDLLMRHRWLIIIVFCIFMVAGIFFSITRPRIYQAITFIKVIPKSVPDEYVPDVTEVDLPRRIYSIADEIKSRTNIEEIIEQYGLFKGPKYKHLFDEDKISIVRRNINVDVKRSRRGVDSFKILYSGDDPVKVMNVVNSLADSFIHESVKVIEDEVTGTKDFLEKELDDKAKRLDEVNEAIKKFREEHLGELPDQLDANLRNLERLQEKQIAKQESLRDLKYNLSQLEKEISEVFKEYNKFEKKLAEIKERHRRIAETETAIEMEKESEDMKKLRELEEQYAFLQSKYTHKHPDIIKLKSIIEQLRIKVAEAEVETVRLTETEFSKTQQALLLAESDQMKDAEDQIEESRKQYAKMEKQRNEIIREIAIHEKDIQDIRKQIWMYEKRVENTPKVELKLLAMERDLKPIQRSYDALLEKREDAVVAVKMEQEQKGQKFRIIDKAKKPQKPISPDMKKLFALFTAAGLGIGIGLTVLLDFLDNSLRRPDDIETTLEVPMLVTIPKIWKPKDTLIYRIKIALSLFAIMIAFFLFSGFGVLALIGVERTLNNVKKIVALLPIISNYL